MQGYVKEKNKHNWYFLIAPLTRNKKWFDDQKIIVLFLMTETK